MRTTAKKRLRRKKNQVCAWIRGCPIRLTVTDSARLRRRTERGQKMLNMVSQRGVGADIEAYVFFVVNLAARSVGAGSQ